MLSEVGLYTKKHFLCFVWNLDFIFNNTVKQHPKEAVSPMHEARNFDTSNLPPKSDICDRTHVSKWANPKVLFVYGIYQVVQLVP